VCREIILGGGTPLEKGSCCYFFNTKIKLNVIVQPNKVGKTMNGCYWQPVVYILTVE
jgi:hypothetical protein